jgi:hypothetical protein
VLVTACLLVAGCVSSAGPGSLPGPQATTSPETDLLRPDRVEVLHFHGNSRCASCIVVGDLAEETVTQYFKEETKNGRLVFRHVNFDQPENGALARQYGVTGSSLWIGVYDATGFHKTEDLRVWTLVNDKEGYESYLSWIITKSLEQGIS